MQLNRILVAIWGDVVPPAPAKLFCSVAIDHVPDGSLMCLPEIKGESLYKVKGYMVTDGVSRWGLSIGIIIHFPPQIRCEHLEFALN